MKISVVVPAHNEAGNIRHCLESILTQKLTVGRLSEVVVVASGCTDDTAEVARHVGAGRLGVHVVVQERREGKVAAINEYLKMRDPRVDAVVMCSADLILEPDVLERIALAFRDHPEVGMVGARPVPDNDPSTFLGKMVCLLWEMHHKVALNVPKMGELVAFRASLVDRVSELSVVDEASVEDIVRTKGYELAYVPEAVVTNHGPETLGEYFEQRRRIARGHYWLEFAFGYQVATLDRGLVARTTFETFREQPAFGKLALLASVATEAAARAVGFWDARVVGGKHRIWKQLESTKRLRRGSSPPSPVEVGLTKGPLRPSNRPPAFQRDTKR